MKSVFAKQLTKNIVRSFSTAKAAPKQATSIAQRFHEIYLTELDKIQKNTYIEFNIAMHSLYSYTHHTLMHTLRYFFINDFNTIPNI